MLDEDLPPPPPAYSEQEFDRKISTALEVSLTINQPTHINDDEEWEQWDDAVHEANARAALNAGSSASAGGTFYDNRSSQPQLTNVINTASTTSVSPLRIHKKSDSNSSSGHTSSKPRPSWYDEAGLGAPSSGLSDQPQVTTASSTKPRPSWYDEAGLGEPSSSSSQSTSGSNQFVTNTIQSSTQNVPPPSPPVQRIVTSTPQSRPPLPPLPQPRDEDEEDDPTAPPPPFTPIGPSLDGPPFEEVVRVPYNCSESTPPSPLTSPVPRATLLPPVQPPSPVPQPQPRLSHHLPSPTQIPDLRQSMPPPPRSSHRLAPRPATATSVTNTMPSHNTPRVEFNPSIAYSRRGGLHDLPYPRSQPSQMIDATAFYNSAVSAHLSSPQRPIHSGRGYPANIPAQHAQDNAYHSRQQNYNPNDLSHPGAPVNAGTWPPQQYAPQPTYPPSPSHGTIPHGAPMNQHPGYPPGGMANPGYTIQSHWSSQNQSFADHYY